MPGLPPAARGVPCQDPMSQLATTISDIEADMEDRRKAALTLASAGGYKRPTDLIRRVWSRGVPPVLVVDLCCDALAALAGMAEIDGLPESPKRP